MAAIYLLSPQQHIVETLVADLEKGRYQRAHLVWINTLSRRLRDRIASSRASRSIAREHELNIDFFPRESHVITFRDPYSFPMLYNPKCNDLVKEHMEQLARKVNQGSPKSIGRTESKLTFALPRLPTCVFRWESIPRYDITSRKLRCTTHRFSATILPTFCNKNSTITRDDTKTTHHRQRVRRASSSLQIDPWISWRL